MRTLIKILIIGLVILNNYTATTYAFNFGITIGSGLNTNSRMNLDTSQQGYGSNNNDNGYLNGSYNGDSDYAIGIGGDAGIFNSIVRIAKDLKNLFYILAGLFLLIITIRLIVSEKTEEEVTNFKKGIIWISVGIVIMQISYYIVTVLFGQNINLGLANNFIGAIMIPLIKVLETATSFLFIIIMFYAFFRMVTANGDEEKAKTGLMSVLYAIIGFIVVKLSKAIVLTVYGISTCNNLIILPSFQTECMNETDLKGFAYIIVKVIDWINSFVGIVVIILIIYAGFLVFTSAGDEEKLKKAKNIIIYIIIGIAILIASYLILTFFILPENKI